MPLPVWVLLLFSLTFIVVKTRLHHRRIPPGPQGFPLLGNLFDFPKSHYGEKFSKMAAEYGDIVHLSLFGQSIIVLSSFESAVEILEKRSANYSDRPRSVMAKLTDYVDWVLVLMQYGPKWRSHRRVLSHSFHPSMLERAEPMLTDVAHCLLRNLRLAPSRFSEHIGFAFADSMMRLIYGIRLADRKDQYFRMAETIVDVGSAMSTPGAFLVDTFPALQYVPSWFPGAQFKRLAATWAAQTRSYRDQLFEAGRASFDDNSADSLISTFMAAISEVTSGAQDRGEVCRGAAATAYADVHGGLPVFFITATNREVQEKAQAELHSVIGSDRLPEFHDRTSLPFMNALIKEVLRWHVISPIGVPHRSVADDVYNGYLIPAGSIVIPNIWAMARDQSEYPDPDCFRPERFLKDGKIDPNVRDPATFTFGFGRRICPGLHFVDRSLFIIFASILHVFKIGPGVDERGDPVPVRMKFVETSLTARPEMFGCSIEPRSTHTEQLVRSLFQ
ncbi:cytochrome P450 [Trametes punicea]|nr:cytochrome P450 [Trametes punicea]